MNKEPIFRKVAIDRISSPEQLDQIVRITSPRSWIGLAALLAIIISALIWGIVGNLPDMVDGMGIVFSGGGVENVMHPVAGKITDVRVEVGTYVNKGDLIALVDLSDEIAKLDRYKKDLLILKDFKPDDINNTDIDLSSNLSDIYDISSRIKQAEESYKVSEVGKLNETRQIASNKDSALLSVTQGKKGVTDAQLSLEVAIKTRDVALKNMETQKDLLSQGAISKNEYDAAERNYEKEKVNAEIAEGSLALAKIQLEAAEKNYNAISRGDQIGVSSAQVLQEKENLELLYAQFESTKKINMQNLEENIRNTLKKIEMNSKIISTCNGKIMEVISKDSYVQTNYPVATVIRQDETINSMEVITYIAAQDAKKIKLGMEAQVSPTFAKKEEYGYIIGYVTKIGEYPVTQTSMTKVLGNSDIASMLSMGNLPVEVRVNLVVDPNIPNLLDWTTSKGEELKVDSGTICNISMVASDKKPIELVIPYIKEKLAGED